MAPTIFNYSTGRYGSSKKSLSRNDAEIHRQALRKYHQDQYEKLAQLFARYDRDSSGFLDREEVRRLLIDYACETHGLKVSHNQEADHDGRQVTEEEVHAMLVMADKDNNETTIAKREIEGLVRIWCYYLQSKDKLDTEFVRFDVNRDKVLDWAEVRGFLIFLNGGGNVTQKTVEKVYVEFLSSHFICLFSASHKQEIKIYCSGENVVRDVVVGWLSYIK